MLTFFKSSLQSVYGKSVFFAYIAMAVLALQQLAVVPLMVHEFGEASYGVFAVYFALASSCMAYLAWLPSAAAPVLSKCFHQEEKEKSSRLFSALRKVHLCFALSLVPVGFALYWIFGSNVLANQGTDMLVFAGALLYSVMLILSGGEQAGLIASARPDLLNLFRIISSLLTLGLLLFILLYFPRIELLFLAFSLGTFLFYLLIRSALYSLQLPFAFSRRSKVKMLFQEITFPNARQAALIGVLRPLIFLDAVFIAFVLDARSVTLFTYYWLPANFVILALWKFSESAQPFFMKSFAENKIEEAEDRYRMLMMLILKCSSLAAIVYIFCLAAFQRLWVGYGENSFELSLLFGVFIICSSLYRLDYAVLYSKQQFATLLKLLCLELGLKLIGIWLLAPYVGFACSIAANAFAHLLVVQWYAKYSVRRSLE